MSPSVAPAPQLEERKTRIFVVGLGMCGIAFIEKVLKADEEGRYKIITCGEEKHLAYNRVGLTDFFITRKVEDLYLNQPEWYAAQEEGRLFVPEFHVGEQVTFIDTVNKIATVDTGARYEFDICVIATGSDAGMPPYCSIERGRKTQGIFQYRSIADLQAIISFSSRDDVKRATVVGGGLLGLEAAKALYDMEEISDVSIINRQAYPLSRQLDASAGEMVLRRIEALGVKVHTNVNVKEMIVEPAPGGIGEEVFKGFEFDDGEVVEAELVVMAVGITPRDDLARASGISIARRGGIDVDDSLMTSAQDIYAIGECASWRGNTYGLIAPGVEMADILAFNLCQTDTKMGAHAPRKMNHPDLSTKLKLMGVDVASFGDFFADRSLERRQPLVETVPRTVPIEVEAEADGAVRYLAERNTRNGRKIKLAAPLEDEDIKSLVFRDPIAGTYKKYLFSRDGTHLLGGMMVGDCSDFVKLVAITKKRKPLDMPPAQFIVGSKSGDDDGADLDDDTQVCSCHNVSKGDIGDCIRNKGATTLADIKTQTKAMAGCGGCTPLITGIFKSEMAKAGLKVSSNLCTHFALSRRDLFNIVKVKGYTTFAEVMDNHGVRKMAIGCEICKPCIGNILSSTVGISAHVMDAAHHPNQETNDKFLGNVQRDGTFSVVPRMQGGEVTPDGLIACGTVAKRYGLYSKITGGQRIDLFGAKKQDLPAIWAELGAAGFESGHAYGKSLRTVKSCVGSSWCRYGVGDSVGLAVQLENRYKGVRSPHKFKGGLSGCVRECGEAQSKDFGLIVTAKGWNIYVAGNGGAIPRHGSLLAADVPPTMVTKILDRYLMYYIYTADKLQRTARWLENMEGGIEKLRKVILDDELGICQALEEAMAQLISTYEDEWARVVKETERQKLFKQFANTDETLDNVERVPERSQFRPAEWPERFPAVLFSRADFATPVDSWAWERVANRSDLLNSTEGVTSATLKWGDTQLALFDVPGRGLYATQQMCPQKRAQVLSHGIVGDDEEGRIFVACPLTKMRYTLDGGECLDDPESSIVCFDAKEEDRGLFIRLPPVADLDAVLSTSKWMVTQAASEALGRGAATAIIESDLEIVGRTKGRHTSSCGGEGGAVVACGGASGGKLDW